MNEKGIGPQGLGKKANNGFWVGSPAKKVEDDPYVKSRIKAKQSPSQAVSFEEFGKKHPYIKAAVQILDPTGISSHGDVKKAWNDGELNSSDIIEPMGALPVLGKFGKIIKGAKVGTDYLKVSKLSKAVKVANRVGDASTAANTPLHKQKSSPAKACWKGYERTPGTKKGAQGSCRKK